MLSRLKFLLSVASTFTFTCNILLKKIFGKISSVHKKKLIKKLIEFQKQIFNFMKLG